MEPKFQSSFIPKSPISSSISSAGMSVPKRRQRDLFSVLASAIFTLSLIFAAGVFAYKLYLNYSIGQMKQELEAARAALEPETVNELIHLNARIISTEALVKNHRIITPVFDFLETITPKSVRYTRFDFNATNKGLELILDGQARGYAALAGAADVINRNNSYLKDPVFSDLRLDDRGNVVFTMRALVAPAILDYDTILKTAPTAPAPRASSTPSSTATSSAATSTTQ